MTTKINNNNKNKNNTRKRLRKPTKTMAEHQCPSCTRSFPSRNSLLSHERNKHRNTKAPRRAVVYNRSNPRGMLANSPYDAKLIEQFIGKRGGGDWALRALDPCAELVTGAVRIPDKTIGSTASMAFVTDVLVSAPTGITAETEWDCMIVAMPFPEAPFWVWKKPSITTEWNLDPDQVIKFQGLSLGSVTQPNRVEGPFISSRDGPTLGQFGSAYRTTYKGFSTVFDAPDLHNQGRVYAGQMRSEPNTNPMTIVPSGSEGEFDAMELFLNKIPVDVAGLQSACPGMVRMRATEGIYVPIHFNLQEHAYQPTVWGPVHQGDTANTTQYLHPIQFGFLDSEGQRHGAIGRLAGDFGNEIAVCSGSDNTQLGVALFMGMSGAANLDIHCEMGLEVEPSVGSPWYPFQEDAPLPDVTALEEFVIVQDQLAVAYPERYNSFSALIPLIGQAVASLASWGVGTVTRWIGSKYSPKAKPVDIPVD